MIKLKIPLTISVIASIMIIGGLIASPDAYSTNDNNEPDECSCEKPDTLKVHFTAPNTPDPNSDVSFKVEIFKKLDDRNNEDKRLGNPINVLHDEDFVISSSNFGKDRLESNTAFVIYEVIDEVTGDIPVALMEIHTSCSKPLFKGLEVRNNEYSLLVEDGLIGGNDGTTSIPLFEPNSCEDKKSKKMGSITIKKAITNDNDGTAVAADFEITITNEETTIILDHDQVDPNNPLINVNNVPAGTYKISETGPPGYTTVLIAGDTGCPSMLEEVFTIKKDKHLSCTIYNDDDKGTGSGGEDGIIFQNNSMQMMIPINTNDPHTLASCDVTPRQSPCIEIPDTISFAIVDPELVSTNTIILFSVVEAEIDPNTGAEEPLCTLERLISHSAITGVNTDTTLTALVVCPQIDTGVVYNVNYVMINPIL